MLVFLPVNSDDREAGKIGLRSSFFQKGRLNVGKELSRGNTALFCSPVTVAELWHGSRPSEHKFLDALFAVVQSVPIDQEIAKRTGEYLRQFRKSHSVELGDALIAATAVLHNLLLWTRNHKHYPMKGIAFYSAGD